MRGGSQLELLKELMHPLPKRKGINWRGLGWFLDKSILRPRHQIHTFLCCIAVFSVMSCVTSRLLATTPWTLSSSKSGKTMWFFSTSPITLTLNEFIGCLSDDKEVGMHHVINVTIGLSVRNTDSILGLYLLHVADHVFQQVNEKCIAPHLRRCQIYDLA